jgi:D-hexose-6-phosphate mutarotase
MVDGLDGRQYRDNTAGGVRRRQSGSMRIRGETVALFDQGGQTLRLVDPLRKRSIVIEAGPQTPSTIVWNPGASAAALADIPSGEESRFVCIESGFIGAERVMLQPGDAHEMSVSYRLEPL